MAVAVSGVAAMALLSGMKDSALSPPLPAAGRAPGWLRFLSRGFGLDSLHQLPRGIVTICVMAAFVLAFTFALYTAWRGRLNLRTVLLLGVAFQIVAILLPLMLSRDVYSYAMYGRIVSVHHANPYVATPVDFPSDVIYNLVSRMWKDTPAVYGPFFTLIAAAVTKLAKTPASMIAAFKIISGACAVGTLFLIAYLAKRLRPERAAFAVAMFGWNPIVIAHSVGGAHNDLIVAFTLTAGLALLVSAWGARAGGSLDGSLSEDDVGAGVAGNGRAPVRAGGAVTSGGMGRELLATALLTLGVLVKATAVFALLLLLVVAVFRRPKGKRFLAGLAHVAVSGGLVLVTAAPFVQSSDPTLGLANGATHEGTVGPTRFFIETIGLLFRQIGGRHLEDLVNVGIRLVVPLAFLLVFAVLAWHVGRRAGGLSLQAQGASWAWALFLVTLSTPVLLPWYIVWTLPIAWLLPKRAAAIVVGTSGGLAISATIAEHGMLPHQYGSLVFGHWALSPLLGLAWLWLLWDLLRRIRRGTPLEAQRPFVPSKPRRQQVATAANKA